jgi:hypothetical protein
MAFAYALSPFEIAGSRWGYVHVGRTDEHPSKVDWTKPYYEAMRSPAGENLSPAFHRLGYEYYEGWDKSVKDGGLIVVEMPDKSSIYLYTTMTKEDQLYLARAFWDRRWLRYADMGKYWLAGLIAPTIASFVLGWSLLWVGRGFAR